MKIATYNVNGIKSRLANLLEWLDRERPDVACLQELKALGRSTSRQRPCAKPATTPCGRASARGTAWPSSPARRPWRSAANCPATPPTSRAATSKRRWTAWSIACLYLPNGNPQPGPKFDYKLAWFERLIAHARTLVDGAHPVLVAGDYNVVPTDFDIYDPRSWRKDALLQPQTRACYERLLGQGWTDAIRQLHPDEPVFTFWDYFRQHWERNAGLRIDHLLLNRALAPALVEAGVDSWVRGRPHASDHAPAWVRLELPRSSAVPAASGNDRSP